MTQTNKTTHSQWNSNHTLLFNACKNMLGHGRDRNSWGNLMATVVRLSTTSKEQLHRNFFDTTNAASGLSAIVTWAGGKTRELKRILSNLPSYDRFFEPFLGGGSVFMGIKANEYFINDFSSDLVSIYKNISMSDSLFMSYIEMIDKSLLKADEFFNNRKNELIDIYNKVCTESDMAIKHVISEWCDVNQKEILEIAGEIATIAPETLIKEVKGYIQRRLIQLKDEFKKDITKITYAIEYAIKAGLFNYYRYLYNDQHLAKDDSILHSALYFFLLQFIHQGKQSFNRKGKLNSSYGKGQFKKRLYKKLDYFRCSALKEHFSKAHIYNSDFEDFLTTTNPQENDFIFLDPPYDETFSKYDNHDFGKEDHIRLADYLLTKCKAKWMMVIKQTDFIYNLYNKDGIYISAYDHKYGINLGNKNNRDVIHLMITNYSLEENMTVPDVEYKEAA